MDVVRCGGGVGRQQARGWELCAQVDPPSPDTRSLSVPQMPALPPPSCRALCAAGV